MMDTNVAAYKSYPENKFSHLLASTAQRATNDYADFDQLQVLEIM